MTTQKRSQRLKSFFAVYFHQDWMEDVGEPGEVIEQYLASATEDEAARLSEDIRAYVGDCPDDAELRERLFAELGCFYDPVAEGVGVRDWLLHAAAELAT